MRVESLEGRQLLATLALDSALVRADGRIVQLEFSGPLDGRPGQPEWTTGSAEGLHLTTSAGTELEPLGTVVTQEAGQLNWTVTCLVPDAGDVITFDTTGLTVSAPAGLIRDNQGTSTASIAAVPVVNHSLVDTDGFTTERFERGDGGVTLYVSSRHGNDSRSLSQAQNPATPLKSLARAVAILDQNGKHGTGSAIRLLRGDVFEGGVNLRVGGQDRAHPMVIEDYWHNYGDGRSDPGTRPIVRSDWSKNQYHGIQSYAGPGERDHVVIRRIRLEATGRAGVNKLSAGLYLLSGGQNWVIDDVDISNYAYGITAQGFGAEFNEFTVLRTIVADSHAESPHTSNNRSAGMYSSQTNDILISQSVFDRNGWVDKTMTQRDVYSHNIYLQYQNTPAVIWGNVIRSGGSHGIQMRSGGILAYNYLGRNGVAAFTATPGGAQIKNVVELGENLTSVPAGVGLEINATAGDVTAMAVEFNIVVNSLGTQAAAIKTQFKTYTIENALIRHNTVVQGGTIFHTVPEPGLVPEAGAVRVESNIFDTGNKPVVQVGQYGKAVETWKWLDSNENLLHNTNSKTRFMYSVPGVGALSLDGWRERTGTEKDSLWFEPKYVNAGANLGSYSAAKGGPATESAFVASLRQRKPGSWPLHQDVIQLYSYYSEQYRITNLANAGGGAYDYYGATDYRSAAPAPRLLAPDLRADRDSGQSQEDNITYYNRDRAFEVRNTAANTTVELWRDGVLVGTRNGSANRLTFLDRTLLADGVYSYVVRQIDKQGVVTTSPATLVTVDTSRPPITLAPDLSDASDTGSNRRDNRTTAARLQFNVEASRPDMVVELWRRDASDSSKTLVRVGSRRGSGLVEDAGPIPKGSYRYVVRQVSVSGATSGYSPGLWVTIGESA
jgi:hypothetical protein